MQHANGFLAVIVGDGRCEDYDQKDHSLYSIEVSSMYFVCLLSQCGPRRPSRMFSFRIPFAVTILNATRYTYLVRTRALSWTVWSQSSDFVSRAIPLFYRRTLLQRLLMTTFIRLACVGYYKE